MAANLIVALLLVNLTGPTGHHVYVNPDEVSSIRDVAHGAHWGPGTRCVLIMTSGKFLAVHETCEQVRRALR
jgi:hypothetical protein